MKIEIYKYKGIYSILIIILSLFIVRTSVLWTKTINPPKAKTFSVQNLYPISLFEANEDYFIRYPMQAQIDSKGNIYIPDYEQHCVKKFNKDGKFILRFGHKGGGPGEFSFMNPYINSFYISSADLLYIYQGGLPSRIQVFNTDGAYLFGNSLPEIRSKINMVVDDKGTIYFTGHNNYPSLNTISVIKYKSRRFVYETSFASIPFKNVSGKSLSMTQYKEVMSNALSGITMNEKGEIFQVFYHYPFIRKFSKNGSHIWTKRINLLNDFPILKCGLTIKMSELPYIDKIDLKTLFEKTGPEGKSILGLSDRIICVRDRHRILIPLVTLSSILEIDYNGNIVTLYYPGDFNYHDQKSIPEYFSSKIVPMSFYLDYSSRYGFAIITSPLRETILKTSLPII